LSFEERNELEIGREMSWRNEGEQKGKKGKRNRIMKLIILYFVVLI
jgi:hypothetical protein